MRESMGPSKPRGAMKREGAASCRAELRSRAAQGSDEGSSNGPPHTLTSWGRR